MVCNEANLDLVLSLKEKIVVSEHNEFARTGHLRVGAQWKDMCVDIHRIFLTLFLEYLYLYHGYLPHLEVIDSAFSEKYEVICQNLEIVK